MSETRARLVLGGGPGLVGRVQELADAESACCAFFTFGVNAAPEGGVALDIEVPTAYAAVLAGLLSRAESLRGSTS